MLCIEIRHPWHPHAGILPTTTVTEYLFQPECIQKGIIYGFFSTLLSEEKSKEYPPQAALVLHPLCCGTQGTASPVLWETPASSLSLLPPSAALPMTSPTHCLHGTVEIPLSSVSLFPQPFPCHPLGHPPEQGAAAQGASNLFENRTQSSQRPEAAGHWRHLS